MRCNYLMISCECIVSCVNIYVFVFVCAMRKGCSISYINRHIFNKKKISFNDNIMHCFFFLILPSCPFTRSAIMLFSIMQVFMSNGAN